VSFPSTLAFYLFTYPPFLYALCRLAVFSDGFSEGALKNLKDGFPSSEVPYTDSYEYLSDSDLDEEECYTEVAPNSDTAASNPTHDKGVAVPDQESDQAKGISSLTIGQSDVETSTATTGNSGGHPGAVHIQPGKVAVIRDMAAAT